MLKISFLVSLFFFNQMAQATSDFKIWVKSPSVKSFSTSGQSLTKVIVKLDNHSEILNIQTSLETPMNQAFVEGFIQPLLNAALQGAHLQGPTTAVIELVNVEKSGNAFSASVSSPYANVTGIVNVL